MNCIKVILWLGLYFPREMKPMYEIRSAFDICPMLREFVCLFAIVCLELRAERYLGMFHQDYLYLCSRKKVRLSLVLDFEGLLMHVLV